MRIKINRQIIKKLKEKGIKGEKDVTEKINDLLFVTYRVKKIDEKQEFIDDFRQYDFNVMRYAKEKNMTRPAIYYRLNKYGLSSKQLKAEM